MEPKFQRQHSTRKPTQNPRDLEAKQSQRDIKETGKSQTQCIDKNHQIQQEKKSR